MKTNLDKVMERGELVDSLHDKTGMSYLFPCFFCCCALLLLLLWYLFFSNTDTCGLGGGNFIYLLQRMLTEIDLSCFH